MKYQVIVKFKVDTVVQNVIKIGGRYYSTAAVNNSVIFTSLKSKKEYIVVSKEGELRSDNYTIVSNKDIAVFLFNGFLYIIDSNLTILHSIRYSNEQNLRVINNSIVASGNINIIIYNDGSYEGTASLKLIAAFDNPHIIISDKHIYSDSGFIILPDRPKKIVHAHRRDNKLLIIGRNNVATIYDLQSRVLLEKKTLLRGEYINDKMIKHSTITNIFTGENIVVSNAKRIVGLGKEMIVIFDNEVSVVREIT